MSNLFLHLTRLTVTLMLLFVPVLNSVGASPTTALSDAEQSSPPEPATSGESPTTGIPGQAPTGTREVPALPTPPVSRPQLAGTAGTGQVSTSSVPSTTLPLPSVADSAAPRVPKVGQSVSHAHFTGDLRQLPVPQLEEPKPVEVLPLRILPGTLPGGDVGASEGYRGSSAAFPRDLATPNAALPLPPAFVDAPATDQNWEGMNNLDGVLPPDTVGDVGMTYYIQMTNLDNVAIYTKTTGALAAGPFNLGTLWPGGDPCNTSGSGDVIVLYDQFANRWMLSQFAIDSGTYYECIAVSSTAGDPVTGGWYVYTFDVTNDGPAGDNWFNDYPKFGIWPDAYYMTANQFGDLDGFVGGAWAFDRSHLLNATTPVSYTYFTVDTEGGLLPSDLDGWRVPPLDSPNYLVSMQDDAWDVPFDMLRVYEFNYYQGNPISSTLSGPRLLPTEPFEAGLCDAVRGRCVPQPDTDVDLESLSDRLMFRLAYRNFGDHEAMVVNHTVRVAPESEFGVASAGVRWYELRKAGADDWTIYQHDTVAPDDYYRWMGSVAMDGAGNLGIGYSVSGEDVYPSIRYTGRKAEDPRNTTPRREQEIITGSGSQTHSAARWGDYSAMSMDPEDDCTFWYTQEYVQTTGGADWQTRIASFKFPACGAAQRVHGTVYDADTLRGLPWTAYGTEVSARPAPTGEPDAFIPGVGGAFSGAIVSGTYDVTARAYGYEPLTVGGVTMDGDVQLDFPLQPAGQWTVEGVVYDNVTGYPVHARITVDGDPFDPPAPDDRSWTDPTTGYYSLTLAAAVTYTLRVEAVGYYASILTLGPLTVNVVQDVYLDPDLAACTAPGYEEQGPFTVFFDDFESGYGNWGGSGLWNPESDADLCGGSVAPFPSPSNAVYYGLGSTCTYSTGTRTTGALAMSADVDLSAYSRGDVTFWSYEGTECGNGNCGFDERFVDVSTNGGSTWPTTVWGSSGPETEWYRATTSLPGGEPLRVRFRFDSNDATFNDYFGWMVDDVTVEGYNCAPASSAVLQPARIEAEGCPCTPQTHELVFANHTGLDDTVNLNHTTSPSVTVLEIPGSLGLVPDGGVQPFEVTVKIDSGTPSGATVYVTVTASLDSNPTLSATTVIEKRAFPGWESVADSAPAWAGVAYPVDGCTARNADGDWVTYLINDTTTSSMPDFVGYHYASSTWFDPGATGVPTGRWAPDWAYDAEGNQCYLTGGASAPGTGTFAEAYLFDPVGNNFVPLPSFTTVRDFHDSWVGHIDGTKYLCVGGGNSGDIGIASTQCYDLDTTPGSWEPENSVMGGYPTDIWGAADGLLHYPSGDQFWVVAGEQAGVITDTAHYFDDADNSWHVAGQTGQPRRRLEGDFKHGDFYQIGGVTEGFRHTPTVVRGRWNGSTWQWEQLADMPNSRMDPVVGVTASSESPETIWVIDGYGDSNPEYVDHLVQCQDCSCRLDLDKTGPEWVYQGGVGGYTINLSNAGACTASANLTDTLPSGVDYADNLSCSAGTCRYDGGDDTVYWEGQVAPYSSVTFTFDVTATAPISTRVVNTARISPTNSILHIYTRDTTDSVQRAMDELGYTYDTFSGDDWTGLDFSPYDVVIAGLDGGFINPSSLQKLRADVIDRGKRLILLGGTSYQSFALGVDQYLVHNDTTNYGWQISDAPQFTLLDPGHPLAQGLPAAYTFTTTGAAVYQTRVTDADLEPLAANGDGYVNYFRKDYPGGDLVWFVHTPFEDYWTDPGDYQVLKQIVANTLAHAEASHAFHVSTPPDITWEKNVYVDGTWVGEAQDGPFSVVPGDSVTIVDRLTYTGTRPLFASLNGDWGGQPLAWLEEAHTTGGVACGAGNCDWGITLLPGASERLIKSFEVTRTGPLSITERLESDETAPIQRTVVLEPPRLSKDGPGTAETGQVIPYTITFETRQGILGPTVMTDVLPPGLAFAGGLTATYGSAWYSPTANAVYWTNQPFTGTHALQNRGAPPRGTISQPAGPSAVDQPLPDRPLTTTSPASGPGGIRPRAPQSAGTALWDQPMSSTNTTAYASHDFEAIMDTYDIYISDDFTSTTVWDIDSIFVPGNLWNTGTSLTNALTLNWHIYADDGGRPDGDPTGGGLSPSWSLSLPPTHTQVTLGAGVGGYTSNVTLTLAAPASLPPGVWWLVFYPRMDIATGGQYGRHVADTTNGYDAQVVNPGGGFGFPSQWTSIQDTSTWNMAQQDMAFRLEGQPASSVVTITFDVTVTAPTGDDVVNTAELEYHDFVLSSEHVLTVPRPEPAWEKRVAVNGEAVEPSAPITVRPGDTVQVVDRVYVTHTQAVTFTLVETWTAALDLVAESHTAGSVVEGSGSLEWLNAPATPNAWHTLTKTFTVLGGAWETGVLTESLWVRDADPQLADRALAFQRGSVSVYLPLLVRNY